MKTNIKQAAVAIALVSMSLGTASPILAQSARLSESNAVQVIKVAGVCDMPEASLCYWPQYPVEAMEDSTPAGFMDVTYLGQPYFHPAVHVSGAEQLIRAGQTFVPEASLYLAEHVVQESGASQLIRAAGGANVFIPEASLYLGEWMPRSTSEGE